MYSRLYSFALSMNFGTKWIYACKATHTSLLFLCFVMIAPHVFKPKIDVCISSQRWCPTLQSLSHPDGFWNFSSEFSLIQSVVRKKAWTRWLLWDFRYHIILSVKVGVDMASFCKQTQIFWKLVLLYYPYCDLHIMLVFYLNETKSLGLP